MGSLYFLCTMDKCTILHTFKPTEMFITFKTDCLSITQDEIVKLGKDKSKKDFAIYVWKVSLEKVINDIIDKGIQFQLPTTGEYKSYICLQRITGDNYVKLRKRGALKNFDPIETDFNAYRIEVVFEKKNGSTFSIPVHLHKSHSDRIAKLAAEHKLKVGPVMTYQDYYDYVLERFPVLNKNDVYRILRYGYNSLRLHLSYGADVFVSSKNFIFHTGKIYTNWVLMMRYVMDKMVTKSRILYRRLHILWDGYCYFSLPADKYEEIRADHAAGKIVDFGNVALYKCYDEAVASAFNNVALFKVQAGSPETRFFNREHLVTDKAELIEIFHDWTWDTLRFTTRTYQTLFPRSVSIQKVYNDNYQPYITWLRARRWQLLKK